MKRLLILFVAMCLLTGCASPSALSLSPDKPSAKETPSQPEAPSAEETPYVQTISPVYTDWSKLTSYETAEPLYTYHPGYGEMLTARSDYGPLLPYIGTMSDVTSYIVDKLPLYGLVTAKGELVTDPVYSNIYYLNGFLLLCAGDPTEQFQGDWGRGQFLYTVAAPDGSWAREVGRCYDIREFGEQLVLTMDDGSVTLLNPDGTIAATFPRSAFVPFLGADFQWNWEGGPNLIEDNGILVVWWHTEENANDTHQYIAYLNPEAGTVSDAPPEGWEPFDYSTYVPDGTQEPPKPENYGYLDTIVDDVMDRTYYCGYNRDTGEKDLLDEQGELVLSGCDLSELYIYVPFVRAGLVSTGENNCFCYKEIATGETVFRFPLRSNSD